MAYKISSRTVTLSMPFDGQYRFTHAIPPGAHRPYSIVQASGGGLNGSTWSIVTTITRTSGGTYSFQATITVQNHGVVDTKTFYILNSSFTPPGSVDVSAAYTGSFEVTETVDRLLDVSVAALTGTNPDGPGRTTYADYEKSQIGSTSTATLTFMGQSVTASVVINSGNRATIDYRAALSVQIDSFDTGSGWFEAPPTINGKAIGYSYSHSFGGGSVTAWRADHTASNGIAGTTLLTSEAHLPRPITSRGVLRRWGSSYGTALTVRISGFDLSPDGAALGYRDVSSSDTWEATYTQERYSFADTITDATSQSHSANKNTFAAISHAITAASLSAAGEDPAATRILMRGFRFNGATIEQAASYSTGFGSGNSRTYSPHQGMSGYRYLDVVVTSTTAADETRTLRITDAWGLVKEWSVMAPAAGAPTTRRLDLLAPQNISYASDSWDNPYPRLNPDDATYASEEGQDGPGMGVTKASAIALVGAAGVTLGALSLVRDGYSRSTYLPSLGWLAQRITRSVVSEAGTTTTYYCRRFWHRNTDGRNEEESDFWWQVTVGGATETETWLYAMLTIAGLCGQITASDAGVVRHPGWSATSLVAQGGGCSVDEPALTPCFLNGDTGLAIWLFGGGILAEPAVSPDTGTKFSFGINLDAAAGAGAATVLAQTLFDEITTWVPDLPDLFDLNRPPASPPEDGLYLAAGTHLRAQAHGTVHDAAGAVAAGKTVRLDDTSDSPTDRGSDVSATDGTYQTGTPYAKAPRSVSVHPTDVGAASVSATSYTRKRIRAAFRTPASGRVLSADIGPTWRAVRAVEVSGALVLEWADNPAATSWTPRATGLTVGAEACVRCSQATGDGRIVVSRITTGGAIERRHTLDEGGTWSVGTTISTTGKHPAVALSDTEAEFHFWWETGGVIKTKVLDSRQQTMIAATTVVASGAADDGIAAYCRGERIFLLYRDTSGVIQTVSGIDGVTYS